jgi:hypothetical protein
MHAWQVPVQWSNPDFYVSLFLMSSHSHFVLCWEQIHIRFDFKRQWRVCTSHMSPNLCLTMAVELLILPRCWPHSLTAACAAEGVGRNVSVVMGHHLFKEVWLDHEHIWLLWGNQWVVIVTCNIYHLSIYLSISIYLYLSSIFYHLSIIYLSIDLSIDLSMLKDRKWSLHLELILNIWTYSQNSGCNSSRHLRWTVPGGKQNEHCSG